MLTPSFQLLLSDPVLLEHGRKVPDLKVDFVSRSALVHLLDDDHCGLEKIKVGGETVVNASTSDKKRLSPLPMKSSRGEKSKKVSKHKNKSSSQSEYTV